MKIVLKRGEVWRCRESILYISALLQLLSKFYWNLRPELRDKALRLIYDWIGSERSILQKEVCSIFQGRMSHRIIKISLGFKVGDTGLIFLMERFTSTYFPKCEDPGCLSCSRVFPQKLRVTDASLSCKHQDLFFWGFTAYSRPSYI